LPELTTPNTEKDRGLIDVVVVVVVVVVVAVVD
jgi:hypothetical protein